MSFDFNSSVPENAKGKKKTSRICEVSGINLVPGNGFEPARPQECVYQFRHPGTVSRKTIYPQGKRFSRPCHTIIIRVFFFPLLWLPAVRGALCRTLRTAGESKDYLRDIRHSSQVQPESSLSTTKQQCELRSRPDSCSEGAQQPSSKSVRNRPSRRPIALFL